MITRNVFAFCLAPLMLGASATVSVAADKGQYNLFNPTPEELMRGFSTDRPNKSTSPYTVDAGHWQVESDILNLLTDKEDGVDTDVLSGPNTTFKLGLTNDTDLEVTVSPYVKITTESAGLKTTTQGFGDMYVRLKYNIIGNDGGNVALTVSPFAKLPTADKGVGNDKFEGGIAVPLGFVNIGGGFGLIVMPQLDVVKDVNGSGHQINYTGVVNLWHEVPGIKGLYAAVELYGSLIDDAKDVATFDTAFSYLVTDNLQLDIGCNWGITDSAADANPYFGISVRF